MVDLLVPPPEDTGPGKLTVGKVYGGMLILENWKLSRFGQGFPTIKHMAVRNLIIIIRSKVHRQRQPVVRDWKQVLKLQEQITTKILLLKI